MKKKNYKLAKPFFQNLLKDKEIRILFEEEKAKTEIAHACLLYTSPSPRD